ncbi:MAG TPA: superinfection immunity protein [Acidobacteriaceae bacterium]|jgi:hypothetical protein|nr:superinfection immunity protein [Acidobacteriaceae bacterium]
MAGLIGVGLYFLPSLVAVARHTHNATGIFLLNLLLGWTGIGWFIALIIAICSSPYPPYWHYYYPPAPCYPPPRRW